MFLRFHQNRRLDVLINYVLIKKKKMSVIIPLRLCWMITCTFIRSACKIQKRAQEGWSRHGGGEGVWRGWQGDHVCLPGKTRGSNANAYSGFKWVITTVTSLFIFYFIQKKRGFNLWIIHFGSNMSLKKVFHKKECPKVFRNYVFWLKKFVLP